MNLSRLLFGAIGLVSFSVLSQELSQEPQQNTSSDIEHITILSGAFETPIRQIATHVSVIDQNDIDARGYPSISDILRHETAIGVSNSGGIGKTTTVRIRGEEGYRTQLYVDGVELLDPTAPQVTPIFDDVLTSQVSRVEILRGPQGLIYGADAGGVIRITTKGATDGFNANLQGEYGRFDTKSLGGSLGFGNDLGNILVSVSDFSTDGFNAQTADASGEADGYENTTLHLKGELTLSDHWRAKLVVRDVESESEFDGCFNASFASTNNCLNDADNTTTRLSAQYNSSRFKHEFGYANTDAKRDAFSDEIFSFSSDGRVQKYNYVGQASYQTISVLFGADFENEEIKTSGLQRNQRGVFTQLQGHWNNKTFVNAGVRYDNNDTFGSFNSVNVNAAHIVNLANQQAIKFKAAYGTGFRAPSLFEQDYNDGPFAFGAAAGIQLSEERSKGFDVGIEWFSEHQFNVELSYFDQSITDEIIFDPNGFTGYLQVLGQSESNGIEFSADKTLSDTVNIWTNYTYNDSETAQGEARVRRPKHLANLGADLQLLGGKVTLSGFARLSKDAVDIGNQALNDYVVFNLNARYQLNDQITFSLRGENIFDREYQEVLGFNTAGASYYLGVQYQY